MSNLAILAAALLAVPPGQNLDSLFSTDPNPAGPFPASLNRAVPNPAAPNPPALHRAAATSPEGRWVVEDGDGVIEIAPCPAGLCGRLVGLGGAGQLETAPAIDWQGRPRCGLTILEAAPSEPGRWEGRITNPEDGTAWHCAFWVDGAGRLNLRGYVLVPLFGQTQTWTRYSGPLGTDCTIR